MVAHGNDRSLQKHRQSRKKFIFFSPLHRLKIPTFFWTYQNTYKNKLHFYFRISKQKRNKFSDLINLISSQRICLKVQKNCLNSSSSSWSNTNFSNITIFLAFFDWESFKPLALKHYKQTVNCMDVLNAKFLKAALKDGKRTTYRAVQHQHWQRVAQNTGKAKEVSMSEENVTSVFYSDSYL